MKVFYGPGALEAPEGGAAVTVGTFDGVHLGHRALIARALSEARARGLAGIVVTWDRHPLETLRPEVAPPLLTPPERKIELLEEAGVDATAVLPFDAEFSTWSPERFVVDVLVKGLGARAVFVGDGWRFGHKAAGDVELLTRLGEDYGFEAHGIDLTSEGGGVVSSSRVRSTVAAGSMELAAMLLGRPFDVDGVIVRGDGRGRGLGFPTANLAYDQRTARPPIGVYAGRARVLDDGTGFFKAAINVGVNPTFGGDRQTSPVRIEAHLLDFDADIYDRTLRVEFWARLRDEKKFESVDDLVAQMGRDVDVTRHAVG